jgi:SAM-dependent methyltransferase
MNGWLTHPAMRGLDVDDPRATAVRRQLVREKAFLHEIYREWYAALVEVLPAGDGPILELGSAGGFLSEILPELITSDIRPMPDVRLVLDGQALPFRAGVLRAIVMTNVLHHLPRSRVFFRDAARSVRRGGRIIMVEPWVSSWSSFIYSRFHHEPFEPDARSWEFAAGGPLSAANLALPWIVFVRDGEAFDREFPEWRVASISPFMPFRYLVSGGVSMGSLMPAWTFRCWRSLEKAIAPWFGQLGMFARIVLERTDIRAA